MDNITPLTRTKIIKIIFWTRFSSIAGLLTSIAAGILACMPLFTMMLFGDTHSRDFIAAGYIAFIAAVIAILSTIAFIQLWRASKGFNGYIATSSSESLVNAFKHMARFWKLFTFVCIGVIAGGLVFYSLVIMR